MAKAKPKTKISEKALKNIQLQSAYTGGWLNTFSGKVSDFKASKKIYTILIILGLVILAFYKKGWFIAAMVNGQPVSNLELQMQLNKQFRTQTINQLVNEKIITDEAAKNNAIPSENQVDAKIADIENSVGGAQALNSILTQQGQDRNSIRSQIKIQIAIEKLYGNEATVSAEEVNQFISSNKNYLKATDSAGQIKEAGDSLKQQKLSQIFSQKFQDLKQKASVKIF